MPDLAAFQRDFVRAIRSRPGAPAPFQQPAFAVYRNTWLKGCIEALDSNYPTVAMLLGAELFQTIATRYARFQRPAAAALALYGDAFPAFLRQQEELAELEYVVDVAVLDRLWTECFFAPDAPQFAPQQYAALRPAEMLGLHARLHPATRTECFETPAVTIWKAHRTDGEFEDIEPEWQAERALIARRRSTVTVTLVDEAAYRVLQELRGGCTLGSAIAHAAEAHPGSDFAGAVAAIIGSGALAAPGSHSEEDHGDDPFAL